MHHRSRQLLSPAKFIGLFIVSVATLSTFPAAGHAEDFKYPLSAVVAADGTMYVADRNLPGIWKITDGKKEIFFQASKKFRTPLNAVRCVALDKKGRLLAGDSATREVYRFDKSGKPTPLTNAGIGLPMSIAVDSDGNLFVADLELRRIWKVPAKGGKPVAFADVPAPRGLAIDKENRVWVVSHGKNHLLRISADGKHVETIVKGRAFQFPHNIVLDKNNTAYISDGYAKSVWKVGPEGKAEKWISGKPFVNPVGLAWQGDNLLIVDPRANNIFVAD
ncbi:MAG: NHL repeat-containing protein, partial [Planctomycetes bacterium]|nr:NHL repeat-containing protein [Planctomycetota bacterium]